ncbi:rhamnan synthesis F family protein [Ectopseudomonas guguanensis]|uniref:Rhamnan synthesis protein F n=1 Tax=Ectopseudomonas guguanensis TaxID=1198456 RepID=A0A1H0TN83_9GAMM|nr:rhamnan synthesis F family protein [Pseudomonas guguanensis]SDP55484.1 Rhamnan synthesis protein F [Pseudomonas guguanensis]
MKIIEQLKNRLIYPAAYSYVAYQSMRNGLRSIGKRDKVHFAEPYSGQKIMLMALYQKGELRADVITVLAAAKAQGIYVIGVNTLKVAEPDTCREYMDCYIERFNYGRDFGSYKSGFQYIYGNGLAEKCPRLLMINDSVFFSKKHVDKFIEDMFVDNIEVLGATENFEIEHHLGSFCIAMSRRILNHQKMKRYWKSYSCTDIRPKVIESGEMELSKLLKSIVRSPMHFRALYDMAHVSHTLKNSPELLENILALSRRSDLVHWQRFTFAGVFKLLKKTYLHNIAKITDVEVSIRAQDVDTLKIHYAKTLSEYKEFIRDALSDSANASARLNEIFNEKAISHFMDCFAEGSQIHQSNIFLHKIGLPIIKLDGLYRGPFNSNDVEKIASDLDFEQRELFLRTMYSRPYGGDVLVGWKLAAFMRGLI